jgi:hypothetical protein
MADNQFIEKSTFYKKHSIYDEHIYRDTKKPTSKITKEMKLFKHTSSPKFLKIEILILNDFTETLKYCLKWLFNLFRLFHKRL